MFASKNRFSRQALFGVAAAALALTGTAGAAQAYHHHHHHHRFGGIVLNLSDGPYAYGSGPSCYWLKRKAIYTGSPYWWKRYSFCMGL